MVAATGRVYAAYVLPGVGPEGLRTRRTVRSCLEAGIPVDLVDSNGFTPLISAAIFGQVEVARILLAAGADPTFRARSHLFRGNKTTTALEQARGVKRRQDEKIHLSARVLRRTLLRRAAEKKGVQYAMELAGHTSSTVHLALRPAHRRAEGTGHRGIVLRRPLRTATIEQMLFLHSDINTASRRGLEALGLSERQRRVDGITPQGTVSLLADDPMGIGPPW
jgi:hypothetical protein